MTMNFNPIIWNKFRLISLLIFITLLLSCSFDAGKSEKESLNTLPDISGLSWIEGNLFVAVHDAKNSPAEKDLPRLTLVRVPAAGTEGITFNHVDLEFPGADGASSDLESVCSFPGRKDFLLVESGFYEGKYGRIFHANIENDSVHIVSYIKWPFEVDNVEATEICQVGDKMIFLYAERAEGKPSTQLRWAEISTSPLSFGEFQEKTYTAVDPKGPGCRPIVALDVDENGFIYIASAFDSNKDDGPFRSAVWQIGRIYENPEGTPGIELGLNKRIANLGKQKVESIAIRNSEADSIEIFIGTDDENFGGVIRMLPN